MSAAYYNEHDPRAAAWLRELMKAQAITHGDVDTRSILDVRPDDLRGFTHCHFFAGIGGWAYALDLAGWPPDRPVWTGSCPCQPWSAAGQGLGADDSRDLWPTWFQLIAECRPDVVFGEQVADALAWFDRLSVDMEGAGYAVGALDLPAASVGAFHRRQRLWFVAERLADTECGDRPRNAREQTCAGCEAQSDGQLARLWDVQSPHAGATRGVAVASKGGWTLVSETRLHDYGTRRDDVTGCGGRRERGDRASQCATGPASVAVDWADVEWIPCRDGKWRPTQSGLQPLAHGVSGRVGRLRGYGNAIVPQVAAAFIDAYLERAPDHE